MKENNCIHSQWNLFCVKEGGCRGHKSGPAWEGFERGRQSRIEKTNMTIWLFQLYNKRETLDRILAEKSHNE